MNPSSSLFATLITFCTITIMIGCHSQKPSTGSAPDGSMTVTPQTPVADTSGGGPTYVNNLSTHVDTTDHIREHFFKPESLYIVIATSGAVLFETPDESAKEIARLPYGDSVQIIRQLRKDTLFDAISESELFGVWVKVKHRQKEGFVFSSGIMKKQPYSLRVDQVHLLFKGYSCFENFQYSPRYHYFALYKRDDGHYLAKTELSFHVNHEIPDGVDVFEWYHIDTDFYEEPVMIIGVPAPLREQKIETFDVQRLIMEGKVFETPEYTLKAAEVYETHYTSLSFTDKNGKQIQTIPGGYLIWAGDIDQDGKLDLLYMGGEEKSGSIVLALSSYAAPGQVLKPVGHFSIGYCC